MLGEAQWTWLQEQLADTTVSMFILLSSVQVIATEQGYENGKTCRHPEPGCWI